MKPTIGQILHAFFEDHLRTQKGLRPTSIKSYSDVLRLFLSFASKQAARSITRLSLNDLTFERVLAFLSYLEKGRKNHIRTRNQRLAAIRTFFEYIASRCPEILDTCQRVAAIPIKRTPPPETNYLEREEVKGLLKNLTKKGRHAARDQLLFLFLYNTGARAQEVADLRIENLDLESQPRVRLHGKGDKWRMCPLWAETAKRLKMLIDERKGGEPSDPVFISRPGVPLTRFGIYKIVRRHASGLDKEGARQRRVTPHLFRHTAAVHLLESGVEINVIRGWLGHVSLETTNRYAELTINAKEAALRNCEPHLDISTGHHRKGGWKDDESLMKWLISL